MQKLRVVLVSIGLAAAALITQCCGDESWKEEVSLHDGTALIVDRSVSRGGRHELGQRSAIERQTLVFTLPGAEKPILWKSERTPDIHFANFQPLALGIVAGTPYLVTTPVGCLAYNKWGRPNPPYIIFQYKDDDWQIVPLSRLPVQVAQPNLIYSDPDGTARRLGRGLISAKEIKTEIASYQDPQYRSVLRVPIYESGWNCPELIGNGKGKWPDLKVFTSQPSYDRCLSACNAEQFSAEYCPCDRIFKDKNK